MRIGVPQEIKSQEGRVALLAAQGEVLTGTGHTVIVEHDAGVASDARDGDYEAAGAVMAVSGAAVYADVELVVKVKEIAPAEFDLLERRHIILANLHGAADRAEEGIALLSEELERDPTSAPVRNSLSRLLYLSGRYARAAEVLREGTEQSPRQYEMANNLALILISCPDDTVGDPAEAVTLMRSMSTGRP